MQFFPNVRFRELPPLRGALFLCLCVTLLLTACRRDTVEVTHIPKEAPPTAATASPHATPGHGDLTAPRLSWVTPDSWQELEPAAMSLANFATSTEENAPSVSIIPLPGLAGKDLQVINIFRERFRLPPLDQAGLDALSQSVPIASQEGPLYDMQSTGTTTNAPARMLIGILSDSASTWYVRMMGEPGAVEDHKPAFLQFLESLSLEAAPAAVAHAATAPPATSGPTRPTWEVPESWTEQKAPNMVLARFASGSGDHAATISVSVFPGDVGGTLANVNRWRGQIGLAPLPEDEVLALLSTVQTVDGEAQIVDLVNPEGDESLQLIGAIVPRGGRTWFYKLTGHAHAAGPEKERFVEFLKSAQHP